MSQITLWEGCFCLGVSPDALWERFLNPMLAALAPIAERTYSQVSQITLWEGCFCLGVSPDALWEGCFCLGVSPDAALAPIANTLEIISYL